MKMKLNSKSIGICVLAYNRIYHLKKTLNSVKKFKHKKDKVFVFLDNYSNKDTKENIILCKQVHKYLESIKDNNFIILKSKKNLGAKKNWFRAYEHMFKIYNKAIVLEDDIVIKSGFFEFMNYYLNKFENNPKVMSITGFASLVDLPKNYNYDCYFSNRSMSWSKATWKRVWLKFKKIKHNHLSIIQNKKKLNMLISCGEDLMPTIVLDYFGKVNSFQIWWIWNIILNSGVCINPINNLINNIGLDGSGFHASKKDKYLFNKKAKKKRIRMNHILFDKNINNSFLKNFIIKKRTYFIFKYFNLFLIKSLLKLKIYLNK